jgi:hypothetical protein
MENHAKDEHSSLLKTCGNYGIKKLYKMGYSLQGEFESSWACIIKLFTAIINSVVN